MRTTKKKKKASQQSGKPSSGEKTIKFTVALWTNDIAKGNGKVRPGHAWDTGAVYMPINRTHGITQPYKAIIFGNRRGLKELPSVVRKVARKNGLVLHDERA